MVPESGTVVAADMEVMDVPDDAEGDDDIEVLEEGHDDSVQHVCHCSCSLNRVQSDVKLAYNLATMFE